MIGSLYAKLAAATGRDTEAEEPTGPKGRPSKGPARYRTATNGQLRRAQRRSMDAQQRKQTRAYRKRWMANERAVAALRGQLQVVGAWPLWDGLYTQEINHGVVKALEETYGSVQAALEVYESLMAERAAKR